MKGTDQFIIAEDLEQMARKIIKAFERVGHVDINKVMFLRDRTEFRGKVLAKCMKLVGKPIQFFTDKEWCIIIYENRTDYMTENQMKVLVLHELMHIPMIGDRVIEHTIQDFREMMKIDIDWSQNNAKIPDILTL